MKIMILVIAVLTLANLLIGINTWVQSTRLFELLVIGDKDELADRENKEWLRKLRLTLVACPGSPVRSADIRNAGLAP